MITKIGTVCIFVSDQDRAKAFYMDVLGFELHRDAPLYPGATARWVSVAPQGAQTEAILYLPDENWEHYQQVVGKSQALTLEARDIQALYKNLLSKGVKFVHPPEVQPWGSYAIIEDSEGNHILINQPGPL